MVTSAQILLSPSWVSLWLVFVEAPQSWCNWGHAELRVSAWTTNVQRRSQRSAESGEIMQKEELWPHFQMNPILSWQVHISANTTDFLSLQFQQWYLTAEVKVISKGRFRELRGFPNWRLREKHTTCSLNWLSVQIFIPHSWKTVILRHLLHLHVISFTSFFFNQSLNFVLLCWCKSRPASLTLPNLAECSGLHVSDSRHICTLLQYILLCTFRVWNEEWVLSLWVAWEGIPQMGTSAMGHSVRLWLGKKPGQQFGCSALEWKGA